MLGYMSTITKEVINNHFSVLHFLIGDFDVISYDSIESSAWIKTGKGVASYKLEGTFITEKVEIVKKNDIVSMNNTMACDAVKNSFNMQTLNYSTGVMDIYKGLVNENVLIYDNIDSVIKAKNNFGDTFNFKLIYKQLSTAENELVVGYSKDGGKTWFPFTKNKYLRK